jgi:hypothetical protein
MAHICAGTDWPRSADQQSDSSKANFIVKRLRMLGRMSTKRTRRLEVGRSFVAPRASRSCRATRLVECVQGFVLAQLLMCYFLIAFIFRFEAQVVPVFDKWSVYIVCRSRALARSPCRLCTWTG